MHADGFCTPDTICTLRWTGWTRFARPSRTVWRQLAHPTPRPGLAGPAHAGSDAACHPPGATQNSMVKTRTFAPGIYQSPDFYRLTRLRRAPWRAGGDAGGKVGTRPNALPSGWTSLARSDARTGHLGHHLHAFPDTLDTGVHVRTDVQYFCPLLVL